MMIPFGVRLAIAFVMPLLIVNRGYKKNSLNFGGACCALLVGFLLTFSNLCFFSALFVFFVLGSFVTKLKSDVKRDIEDGYKEGGQRNWTQVICNGGVAAIASFFYLIEVGVGERPIDFAHDFNASILSMAVLGSLACSSGDTWSSEIGSVYARNPRLITTGKRVPVGTNGGVTFIGTLASILGGAVVGLAYYVTMVITTAYQTTSQKYPPQWPLLVVAVLGGFLGSITDSVLGAKLQYSGYCEVKKRIVQEPSPTTKHITGRAILSNHGVNLVASSSMAFTIPVIAYFIWQYI